MDGDFRTGFLQPRQPPHSLELERALLGAFLCNNKAYERVSDVLTEGHFAEAIHGRIYSAIQTRVSKGSVADLITLKADLEHACVLEEIGGLQYLTGLVGSMVATAVVPEYAKTLVDLWRRRAAIDIGQQMVDQAFDSGTDVLEIATHATDALDQIVLGDDNHAPTFMSDAMMDAIEVGLAAAEGERVSMVSTGLPTVDQTIGDMEPGDVYILAGRPGVGKSAVALQIALHNALNGIPVDYYSTEMQARQLGRRGLALLSGVSAKAQKRGGWSATDDVRLQNAWGQVSKVRGLFNIQDCPGLNLRLIAAKAKGFARKHPGKVGLVVIDHMHDLGEMHEDQMTSAIGKIMVGAKNIAKTIGWPVLILSQMNRKIDERDEKRPEVADLYGGMQIEAMAHSIMLLHRPDKYLNPSPPEKKSGENLDVFNKRFSAWEDEWNKLRGKLEMFIPKVRDGEPGYVALKFDGPSNRSTEMGVSAP